MKFNRATVLILSSDPAFSRELTESWPKDAPTPEFVFLEGDLCRALQRDTYDLAIADAPSREKLAQLKQALAAAGKPAIVVYSDGSGDSHCISGPIIELCRRPEFWPAMPALLGREILRRALAESHTRESENARTAAEGEAILGRYMAEMSHTVNNALTAVLGNAELLLVEPGLPAPVMAQADTIRNMALRINEVFHRFSSIEKELSVAAREAGKRPGRARAAASGL